MASLMALVTTFMTGPLLSMAQWTQRRTAGFAAATR